MMRRSARRVHIWRVKDYAIKRSRVVRKGAAVDSILNIAFFEIILRLVDMPPEHAASMSHIRNLTSGRHIQAQYDREKLLVRTDPCTKDKIIRGYSSRRFSFFAYH